MVNDAGRGLLGAVEEATDPVARAVFDTNVFVLNVQRPVRRYSAAALGPLLQISSIGRFTGTPGWGVSAATKFAVEGFSEALAGELWRLGIRVTIVEPACSGRTSSTRPVAHRRSGHRGLRGTSVRSAD